MIFLNPHLYFVVHMLLYEIHFVILTNYLFKMLEHICYYLQIEYFQNMTEEKITQLYASVTDSISFLKSLYAQTTLMHDTVYVANGMRFR